MKKATIAAIVLMAGTSWAQQKQTRKPLSDYMREVGLIYVETMERFRAECDKHPDKFCDPDDYRSAFESLDSRIEITLSHAGRPSGDKPFFDLLQAAYTKFYSMLLTYRPPRIDSGLASGGHYDKAAQEEAISCEAEVKFLIKVGRYEDSECWHQEGVELPKKK